ncbi:MAG: type II toxin-antitoxin system RelE/ParE family toxin [Bacteroidota bacterium]
MAEIIWSYKSYEDFQNIIEYIAKDSEHYASLTAKKIWHEIRRIKHNPMEARMVPEAGFVENIREFIIGNYRIIFELKDSKAYLLTIHHNSRDLNKSSLFEKLK